MALSPSNASLGALPASVSGPQYDRAGLSPGIVHIGVGNFHRAHQAIYLEKLFNLGRDHDWALIGAGLKPYDTAMRDKLAPQDWLTTVVELDPNGLSAQVCGAMIDFIETDPATLVERLIQPDIRIVSLTITEGGYFVDPNTGGFDASNPEIQRDLANPGQPATVFGVLVRALRMRRDAGLQPFTVMSCDNLPGNGHVARQAVIGYARALDPKLAVWIEHDVAFPNGMVDCITPATGDREKALVRDTFGIDDAAPVVCEPFRQWVLEDHFPAGRPALEEVGVEFVADVAPYELMKLRILNGGHATIAYPGALLGYHYAHDAMADPLIRSFLTTLERAEIIPTVPLIDGVSFEDYLTLIIDRFSNPAVGDTIPRLCLDGSNRQPKFILPTIAARIETGKSCAGLALETALWCRYCLGTDGDGNSLHVEDEKADELRRWAQAVFADPATPTAFPDLFGKLAQDPSYQAAFRSAAAGIKEHGVRQTLHDYIENTA